MSKWEKILEISETLGFITVCGLFSKSLNNKKWSLLPRALKYSTFILIRNNFYIFFWKTYGGADYA